MWFLIQIMSLIYLVFKKLKIACIEPHILMLGSKNLEQLVNCEHKLI